MDIYPTSSEYAHWPVESDVDLTTATFEVYLEGAWRTTEWVAAAVQTGDTWTRTARLQVAGPSGSPGLVLTTSHRHPKYRITTSGETIVRDSRYSLNMRT